jgi:hypothetical protein
MNKILDDETRAILDVLTTELGTLGDLIATEQDDGIREELKQEQTEVIARINNLLGTDHIAEGSKTTTINNDLNKD